MNNRTKGKIGEKIACDYLKKAGYTVLETNFRYSRLSEVDIIAKEKDTLVFVEVKTRSSTAFGHPFEAINTKKLQHIYQTALYYMQNEEKQYKNFRIDIISVLSLNDPKIEHLKNVSIN